MIVQKNDKLREIRFAGYASLFDIPDAARDTIRKGAFRQSLINRSRPLPLLWQHSPHQPIGHIEMAEEDARGLRIIAVVDRPQSRAASLLKAGTIDGLSFGYRAKNAIYSACGRELLSIDLFEISLVTHPLQHGARVHLID